MYLRLFLLDVRTYQTQTEDSTCASGSHCLYNAKYCCVCAPLFYTNSDQVDGYTTVQNGTSTGRADCERVLLLRPPGDSCSVGLGVKTSAWKLPARGLRFSAVSAAVLALPSRRVDNDDDDDDSSNDMARGRALPLPTDVFLLETLALRLGPTCTVVAKFSVMRVAAAASAPGVTLATTTHLLGLPSAPCSAYLRREMCM